MSRNAFVVALLALTALLVAVPAGALAAEGPQPLWQRCDGSPGDLSCSIPRGIGVSPTTGHLYVADSGNTRNRIVEYTAWGELVGAWGWGVATGAAELQVCTAASSCKAGIKGGGSGQFNGPVGVAVDATGNVYVDELFNRRVQKFDSEGHFLVMFGGQVNKTKVEEGKTEAEQNRCPVDPADLCQAGTLGAGKGQFNLELAGSFIATGPSPSNLLYVGDKGRVQVFNPNGTYKEDFPDPEGIISSGGSVQSLAAAPSGGLYLAFKEKPDVTRLTSAGKASASPGCVAKVANPRAVAMATNSSGAPTGNLYVFEQPSSNNGQKAAVRQFSAACADKEAPFATGDVSESTGIAAGAACLSGGADVYLSNTIIEGASIRAYGPAPDKTGLCPKPLLAPEILTQYATSVGTVEAVLRAQINPRFYADTTYQIQYGTAECLAAEDWEAPCVKEQPASPASLGAEAIDFPFTSAGVVIGGLSPATEYRYRFLAQSSGGGPSEGAEQSFTTFATPQPGASCPNETFRIGPSTLLPDCRAYELVSPVDKEGGQILTLKDINERLASLDQAATSGDKLTYSSYNSFGDPESSPYTSQYIASRGGGGWTSEAISPPRGVIFKQPTFLPVSGIENEFEAFSANLCSAWLVHNQTTAPPLAAGGNPFYRSLYKRDNCDSGAPRYEFLAKATSRVQGLSADGETAIFRTIKHLSQAEPTAVGTALNCESPTPITATFQWLREGAPIPGATSSQYIAKAEDEGKAVQCRMKASGGGAASVQDANPVWAIAPYPSTAPPLAPQSIPAPTADGPLAVGGAGGQQLGCDPAAAAWEGSPGFTFQWYRNGTAIPGAESPEYTVQAADLASATFFQCEVLASNAGGKVAELSDVLASDPAPSAPVARPDMATEQEMVYESFGEGQLRAVCIEEDGTQSKGCSAGTANLFNSGRSATVTHALSSDASRVFWTNSNEDVGKIYLRLNGETTVPVSAAATSNPARFWLASADGSRAIISGSGSLYEIGLADPEAPTATLIAKGFKGVVGASDDATALYFVSTEALPESGENSEEASAVAGQPNLYLRRLAGEEEEIAFVGTLAGADIPSTNAGGGGSALSPVAVEPYEHAARVSADGQSVAFMSRGSLTGYDNADAVSGEADAEVFVYGADSGQLSCASCVPSGARPSGRVVVTDKPLPTAAQLPPIQSQLYFSHVLSEDGTRVFFQSYGPLVLADTNGKADVYEWERPGAGACKEGPPGYSPLNEGCVTLISSGKSPVDSTLLDASPSGRDVFFITGSSLLPYDPGSIDIYDARAGGGFPLPPAPQPPCEGEACQAPPPPPAEVTPASAAFRGAGNPAARKHAKHRKQKHKKHKRAQRKHGRAAR